MIIRVFFGLLLLFCLTSCVSKRISNFEEIQKFYRDLGNLSCQERINNDYWIKILEERYDYWTNPNDVVDFDSLPDLPLKDTLIIEVVPSIKVNYAKTIRDLKRTNRIETKRIFKCQNYYRNTHISLPIFNEDKTIGVIEDRDGTTLYKKNKNGKWEFHELGLIRVY